MRLINKLDLFRKTQEAYRRDPVLFCRETLGVAPDKWQEDVLLALAGGTRVSVRSGQGVGKTGVEAWTMLWFLSCFPYSRVVATAPTRQQLSDVLWAEAYKWLSRSAFLSRMFIWTKTRVSVRGREERWYAVARTATRPENMQGFHEDNMLFIVDEASGIRDDIMEAILGTLSGINNKLLMCGNPTRTSGVFYDSHTKDRAAYTGFRVSSRESLRTNKDNIASLERRYGAGSNVVRVRVDGEFPLQEDDVFIPLPIIESTVTGEGERVNAAIAEMGVDVARFGDDETVIAVKVGGAVQNIICRRGQDLMRTTGDIISQGFALREKKALKRVNVKIDDTGLGGGVTDRLNEVKREQKLSWLTVTPVNFAQKIPEDEAVFYADFPTYLWANLRDLIKDAQISLPNDPELIAQLSTRKYKIHSSGRIKLEGKDELKKRGLPSPDRAEAVALACYNNAGKTGATLGDMGGTLDKESYWRN